MSSTMDVNEFSEETREASPANLLIKIKDFSLLSDYGIKKYESRAFEAGGYKWKLIIYPDGDESKDEGGHHVSVYLSVAETSSLPVDWEINAICSIFLYNKNSDNYLCFRGKTCRFHAISSVWGSSKMISKKTLTDPKKGYLVDDTCVFGAEVFVTKSQRLIDCLSLVREREPYRREWQISGLSKFEDAWISDDFFIGDHRWRIELCPNEYDDRYVSVFLQLFNPKICVPCHQINVNVDCRFRIKNNLNLNRHHSRKFQRRWLKPDEGWGFPDFIETTELRDPSKGFVINDCCFLEVKIYVLAFAHDSASAD
ncbi:hypothetical protein C2S52_006093 [Perilla frutescens var. hirtella]|nr:hypothetical protein C2S52_006093 [Perilla frutescens var. hirtella]